MAALSIPPAEPLDTELERRGFRVVRSPCSLPVSTASGDDAPCSVRCARCASDWGPFASTSAGPYCLDCQEIANHAP